MNPGSDETSAFIEMSQMFLVPASILFASIGIARTEPLKALISLLGALLAALWFYRIFVWTELPLHDWRTGIGMAGIFCIASLVSTVVHIQRMRRGVGKTPTSRTKTPAA